MMSWNRLECEGWPLNLAATLRSGQSFRWRQDTAGIWWGVVEESVVALWQAPGRPDSPLYWQTFPTPDRAALVTDYFRWDVDLVSLYADWRRSEPALEEAVQAYRGLRILRQPPLECFFAFQCATCNTILKIERSVQKLAVRYGRRIALTDLPGEAVPHGPTAGGWVGSTLRETFVETREAHTGPAPPDLFRAVVSVSAHPSFAFYAFPTLEALARADEQALRADLWGYRSPRVIALARTLQTLPENWLPSLRSVSYTEAKAALVRLHGIGEKLADCICLFALDKDEATPVDTHVRQIAGRLFALELEGKSLTPRLYETIASAFRDRFGSYAGWAQQYLFFGDLRRASEFAK